MCESSSLLISHTKRRLTLQGLPADGLQPDTKAYDYYTTFAIQYYSLLLAKPLERDYPLTAKRYRHRAMLTAPLLANLFASNGNAIPFGRSMTYRFACSAFWAAVAYDGLQVSPRPGDYADRYS